MNTVNSKNAFYCHGWQEEINILNELSKYEIFNSDGFPYDEKGEDTLPRVFFRVYHTKTETTLEEAIEGLVKRLYGVATAEGEAYGMSEVTIEGFNLYSLTIGGHDIDKLLKGFPNEYLHVLIDVVPNAEQVPERQDGGG